jgi:hypothetical protein
MWDSRRDDNETPCRVPLQLRSVEPFALAHEPSPFDHRNQFVLWVCMGEDALAGRDLHSVDPRSALVGVAEQLSALSPVFVVSWREPAHLLGRQPDHLFFILTGPDHCHWNRRKNGYESNG